MSTDYERAAARAIGGTEFGTHAVVWHDKGIATPMRVAAYPSEDEAVAHLEAREATMSWWRLYCWNGTGCDLVSGSEPRDARQGEETK